MNLKPWLLAVTTFREAEHSYFFVCAYQTIVPATDQSDFSRVDEAIASAEGIVYI